MTDPAGKDPKQLFTRTTCGCQRCVACCQHKPGALTPHDLDALLAHQGVDAADEEAVLAWAEEHLQASDGSQILQLTPAGPRLLQLPTLVPRLWAHGCEFLDEDNRCDIHEVAPYACSHFDTHMSDEEANRRSHAMQRVLLLVWRYLHNTLYQRVWTHLREKGLVPPPLAQRQGHLLQALEQLDAQQEQP